VGEEDGWNKEDIKEEFDFATKTRRDWMKCCTPASEVTSRKGQARI
jgi:hypothetical protein